MAPGYGPGPGFAPQGQPGGVYGAPDFHPLAIASLVCGILAIVPGCCCMFYGIALPIASIVCGVLAMMRISAERGRYKGDVMAIVGIILGGLSISWDVFAHFSQVDDAWRQQYWGH
jgi:hypothetical protein